MFKIQYGKTHLCHINTVILLALPICLPQNFALAAIFSHEIVKLSNFFLLQFTSRIYEFARSLERVFQLVNS